jgi:ribosomal protein S18 acetylase RimI-like enzyme
MTTPFDLRPYRPDDWRRLCEIHDAARRDELAASGLADAFLDLNATAESEGLFNGTLTVLDVGGRVEGFIAFSATEITWLYVDPAAYRRGFGRALLRHAFAQCGGTVSLEVLVGNDAALQLYLAEGFRIVRRVDGRLTGNESHRAAGLVLERPGSA